MCFQPFQSASGISLNLLQPLSVCVCVSFKNYTWNSLSTALAIPSLSEKATLLLPEEH